MCSAVVVCASIACAVVSKLCQSDINSHIHGLACTKTQIALGSAPLGGPCLKQEVDVAALPANIGQVVCVCVCVSVFISMSLLSVSRDTHSTHPLLCICGLLDSIDQFLKA